MTGMVEGVSLPGVAKAVLLQLQSVGSTFGSCRCGGVEGNVENITSSVTTM